jgi:hypothetical protein
MPSSSRINRLSTRFLTPFKAAVYVIYIGVFGTIVYLSISGRDYFMIFNIAIYGYFLFRLWRMLMLIKHVEFDDTFLYVIERGKDVMIPLANIESVEIMTLGGVYKVNLYFKDIVGDHFYFKPSLIYPLNYASKDKLVNLLRFRIDQAKQKNELVAHNALMS